MLSVSCELMLNLALALSWVNGTPVEAKLCTITLEYTHFIFNLCPIYTHDGASAKFSTNSQETDYSVSMRELLLIAGNNYSETHQNLSDKILKVKRARSTQTNTITISIFISFFSRFNNNV
jgi:hypothetical protein